MKDISIFLTRNNNDLDHLTAILYKDFLDKKEKCLIVIISNEELELNPRLVYLKKIGFQIVNFYSWLDVNDMMYDSSLFGDKKLNNFSRIHRLANKIIGQIPFINKSCRYILNKIYNSVVKKYSLSYDQSLDITKSFLSNYVNIDNIKNLFFDIQQQAVYPHRQFCEVARQINAKIIMYHHAIINYDNDFCNVLYEAQSSSSDSLFASLNQLIDKDALVCDFGGGAGGKTRRFVENGYKTYIIESDNDYKQYAISRVFCWTKGLLFMI